MADAFVRILEAFYQAKRVIHYYWLHTDGDAAEGVVSVENLQQIIAWICDVTIEKIEVDVESDFYRAFIERKGVRGEFCTVYVIAGETPAWKRFAATKELCHILIDDKADFQADPLETIKCLKNGSGFLDEHSTPEEMSEKLAEVIALELIYPLEFRRIDLQALEAGSSHQEIADLRKIPVNYVHVSLRPAMVHAFEQIWKRLDDRVEPPNLDHKFS